jgi:hypothetical protein
LKHSLLKIYMWYLVNIQNYHFYYISIKMKVCACYFFTSKCDDLAFQRNIYTPYRAAICGLEIYVVAASSIQYNMYWTAAPYHC